MKTEPSYNNDQMPLIGELPGLLCHFAQGTHELIRKSRIANSERKVNGKWHYQICCANGVI